MDIKIKAVSLMCGSIAFGMQLVSAPGSFFMWFNACFTALNLIFIFLHNKFNVIHWASKRIGGP